MEAEKRTAMIDPAIAVATISLIQTLIMYGPAALKMILDAWGKVDPTEEDFDALALLAQKKLAEKKEVA